MSYRHRNYYNNRQHMQRNTYRSNDKGDESKWLRITDDYVFFWQATWPSNLYLCTFVDDKKQKYCCNEQYFMVKKALRFGAPEIAEKILQTRDTSVMKRLGRMVVKYDEKTWNSERDSVMEEANRFKFLQNPILAAKLEATGKRELVEASPVDTIWGVGLAPYDDVILDKRNWRGQNRQGRVLMKI